MASFYLRATLNGRPIDEPVEGLKWIIRREYRGAKIPCKFLSDKGHATWRRFARIFDTEGEAADALPKIKDYQKWRVVPIEVFD